MRTAYWWTKQPNWGDALAPLLLKHFAGIEVRREVVGKADIVCVGSVIEHIPPESTITVIGAGKLQQETPTNLEDATILALRGPYTAKGIPGDYAIGDPGLLADELVKISGRTHELGILPHWSDTKLEHRFSEYHPIIIHPHWHPLRVIAAIGSCKKLVTSSLHGMVVADAFGVPRRFEMPPKLDYGGCFKHADYSASLKAEFVAGVTMSPSRFHVEDRRNELLDAFKALPAALEKR